MAVLYAVSFSLQKLIARKYWQSWWMICRLSAMTIWVDALCNRFSMCIALHIDWSDVIFCLQIDGLRSRQQYSAFLGNGFTGSSKTSSTINWLLEWNWKEYVQKKHSYRWTFLCPKSVTSSPLSRVREKYNWIICWLCLLPALLPITCPLPWPVVK